MKAKMKIFFNQCSKRNNCGLINKKMVKVLRKILTVKILNVILKEWCLSSLLSTTTKRNMKHFEFFPLSEERVTKRFF